MAPAQLFRRRRDTSTIGDEQTGYALSLVDRERLGVRRSLLGRSSETITGIHDPAQHQLGCVFIHLLDASDQAIPRGGLWHQGGQERLAHRIWWKPLSLLLGLASELFIGTGHPTQYLLGYAFMHMLGASEHFFCTTVPMQRIVISRHGSNESRKI
jgi:hypothetical protein